MALTCVNAKKCQSGMDVNATGYQSVMCSGISEKECRLARQSRLAGDTQERRPGKKNAAVRITYCARQGAMKGRNMARFLLSLRSDTYVRGRAKRRGGA